METPEGSKMKRSRDVGDAGRCSKQSSKRSYGPKKKRFAGNRYTKAKKDLEGYRLLDINLLESMVASLSCPELYLEEDEIKGLIYLLYVIVDT